MVAPVDPPTESQKRALVVQRDEDTRRLISSHLAQRGFSVDACATLAEGRASFSSHPLVVAPAERDAISPNGFIAWLRQHSSRERAPYILAVSDRETSQSTPPPNRAWDELLLMPLDDRKLQSRLEAIQGWVENRLADIQKNAPQLNPETTRVAIRPLMPPPKPPTPKLRVPPPPLRPKKVATPDLVDPAQLVKQPKLKRDLPPPPKAPTSTQPTAVPPAAVKQVPAPAKNEDAIFEPAPFQPVDQATQLQALIDNAPIAMALFDREMRYLALNRRWLADFSLAGADLIGRSHLEVFPNLGPAWQRVYARALQGHAERCEEDLWVRQDGSQDWVRWDVRPWLGADGKVAGITMTCEVINRLVEHYAKDHNTTVGRSLLHGKVTPVVSIDLEGHIESISEACLAYIPGGDEAAIEGEHFWEVFSLDPGRDKLKRDFLVAARDTREGERFAFPPSWSHPARLATGGRTVLVWANSPRYDTDGRVSGVLCIGITQSDLAAPPVMRKPIETEPKPLPKAEMETTKVMTARPEQLLEQASFGIILLDHERNTLYANPEHSRLLGHDVRDFADIEEWLAQAVPESSNGVLVLESWRENVWQKQVTKTLTLRNREKALRQIEFRPRPTADGGLMLTLFDVTEKRRSEEALRASEAKFRALFQHAGVGIALEDRSGNFFDVNPLFERMVAAQRHEIRKTRVRDWIHDDDWPDVMNYLEDQKNGSVAAGSIEVRLNQKSGAMLWSRTTISRIVDHNGRSIFTAYFFHDITNERKVDATLKAAQEEHRALLGAIPDLILMLDRGGRVVDLIPAAAGSLITDSAQAIGKPLAALIPGFEDRVPQLIERAATKDPVSVVEFRDEANDRFYKARFVRCSDDRFVCVIQDETTGQRANDAMQRHALTFDHNCEGIVITDLSGKITDYNDAAERIFGYARAEIIGHTLSTLFSPNDRPTFNQRVADALSNGKWAETSTFVRPDGSEGQCEVYYVAIAEEDRPPAIIGVNREVKPGESSQSLDASASAVAAGRMAADLQTIIKLISLHLSFASSTDLRFALRQNQERIRSIALIHQLLEAEGSIDAQINLLTYLKQLRRAVLQDFNVAPEDIVIRLVCPEDALVPASQALAIGLITSEFLAETLQHAGISGRSGALSIIVTMFKGFAEFRIEDDGLEIPDNLKTLDGSDLSMEIIKSLSQQLDAELSLIANPQHALSLRFPVG